MKCQQVMMKIHSVLKVDFRRQNKTSVEEDYTLVDRTGHLGRICIWPCYAVYSCGKKGG